MKRNARTAQITKSQAPFPSPETSAWKTAEQVILSHAAQGLKETVSNFEWLNLAEQDFNDTCSASSTLQYQQGEVTGLVMPLVIQKAQNFPNLKPRKHTQMMTTTACE